MKAKIQKPHPWIALTIVTVLIFLGALSIRAHFLPQKPEIKRLWDSWLELRMAIGSYQSDEIQKETDSLDAVSRKKAIYSYNEEINRHWPANLGELIPLYLDQIPCDPNGNQKVVSAYDGTGGWVYENNTGVLVPNIPLPSYEAENYRKLRHM